MLTCVYRCRATCLCVTGLNFDQFAQVGPSTVISKLPEKHPWLLQLPLVVKPDQLIKRRGKSGLILLNAQWADVVEWVEARRGKDVRVEKVSGVLDHFLIEPFMPHAQSDEFYICIHNKRQGDEILFHHEGGVDVGDVDSKAIHHIVPLGQQLSESAILSQLLVNVPEAKRATLASFVASLYAFYVKLHYSYLEINPLVVTSDLRVLPLDLAAKIDETAKFEAGNYWSTIHTHTHTHIACSRDLTSHTTPPSERSLEEGESTERSLKAMSLTVPSFVLLRPPCQLLFVGAAWTSHHRSAALCCPPSNTSLSSMARRAPV